MWMPRPPVSPWRPLRSEREKRERRRRERERERRENEKERERNKSLGWGEERRGSEMGKAMFHSALALAMH